jgi:hypothetical protein
MLSGRRIGRIGENRSGPILGPWASRRVPGLNRSACLDILFAIAFCRIRAESCAWSCCARVTGKTAASNPARQYGLELLLRSGS